MELPESPMIEIFHRAWDSGGIKDSIERLEKKGWCLTNCAGPGYHADSGSGYVYGMKLRFRRAV